MSKYSSNMPPDIAGAIGWVYDRVVPGTQFLDFGCSTGYFGSFIKNKGIEVYGVEISDDSIEAVKVLDGVYSFDLDGDWPKEIYDRRYDYIMFGDVLEHLKNPSRTLLEAKKLLKVDGEIFVSVPNIAHMSIPLELLSGSFIYEPMGILDNTHLQYFTRSTFTAMATEVGLDTTLIDFTSNDIPKEIYQLQLRSLGLKAEERFWKQLNTVEARAYQFKFILTPIQKKKPKNINFDLSQKPLQFRDDILSDFKKQISLLDDHSKKQAAIIEYFQTKAKQAEQRADQLEENLELASKPFSYTVTEHFKKAYHRVIGRRDKRT